MISNFIDGLIHYEFLQNALITCVVVGLTSGVVGSFIVLRGMSLMGDAISHAVLPGVAISYMLGINYIIGATVFGIATAGLIGVIGQKSKLKNDAAIGIVFSSFFALGVILISFAQSSTDLYHILFGNVLAVRQSDIMLTLGVAVIVLSFIAIFYKELLVSSFDPVMAEAYGLNTKLIHYGLMFGLTLVAVTALQTIGTILVVALLITPASTAYLLTNKLSHMIWVSSIISVISSVVGLFFSYSFNLASGAAIVMTAAFFFILAFIFSPKQGFFKTKKVGMEIEKN
ncbi:metal ABC transporter permease [Vagococcus coleopterorum]|uniref:Manganese import system permease protein ScaB n=1 Tax=Vagococcus coleopterorum TaxID=2714946 RepID=A0A6G8AL52_9ENTE|nr:metal ABC transporter permease [Vagococcus coleopterorum]QIL45689.1 metal ABC transporter permease [Vagococcus coleopterorum]